MNRKELIDLARSQYISDKHFAELAKLSDWYIRWLVADNPITPLKVLIELSKDRNDKVRKKAKAHLATLAHSKTRIFLCTNKTY